MERVGGVDGIRRVAESDTGWRTPPPPRRIEERGEVELGNRARVMGGVSLRVLPGCLLLQHPPH